MKRMTPATRLLRDKLIGKYLHFSKRNMLADDGSFYCLDNYISENVFLRLPFAKSIIFSRGKLTAIANHEFLFNKVERDRIISVPFGNTSQ